MSSGFFVTIPVHVLLVSNRHTRPYEICVPKNKGMRKNRHEPLDRKDEGEWRTYEHSERFWTVLLPGLASECLIKAYA